MRTFVAVEVTNQEAIRSMIEFQKFLLGSGLQAKPVGPNQLHFTLIFLGEVNEAMIDSIKSSLADIRFDPVEVTYRGVGAFPSFKQPRVIWIGVDDSSAEKLVSLAGDVESRLSPLGFRNDRPFRPHLTLFRVKNRLRNAVNLLEHKDRIFGKDILQEVKVKKSDLTPSGPVYSDLFVIRGGGG